MDGNGTTEPHSLEQLALAALGWATMTVEASEELADDLARRVGVDRGEMRAAVRDAVASWRAEAEKLGSVPAGTADRVFERIGVVRRDEADDLALRVAQLEHRVRLLENPL
jgi:polyhydroxyalkanoate synthesis regulator phasin